MCKAVTTDIESHQMILLFCEAYSFWAEDVKSENLQLLKLINTIFRHLEGRGIHAMDRGGDRGVLYKKYLGEKKPKRFVIRLVDRDLIHQGRRRNCCELAKVVSSPYETVLIVYEEGKEKKRTVHYNAVPVKLLSHGHKLYLVVMKGFVEKPMMLLTSCLVERSRKEKTKWSQ